MPIKNKTMALIRLRKTPYSSLLSFLKDVFYKQEDLADKALAFLGFIYQQEFKASDWSKMIEHLFEVKQPSSADDRVIDEACFKYLGFHRENINASKARLRGKKAYMKLLESPEVDDGVKSVLKRVSDWNGAVASYYSVINKLKALGLVEKNQGYYVSSDKFKRRFSQVLGLLEGFETEVKQK
jgi:hypothetical protein